MTRLTEKQLSQTAVRSNALGDREMDLRGLALTSLDALLLSRSILNDDILDKSNAIKSTAYKYLVDVDTINVTDNDLTILDFGVPTLLRFSNIIASNNRLSHLSVNLSKFFPNLNTLILDNNKFTSLSRTGSILSKFKYLRTLSLLNNPVINKNHYRLYLIAKCPRLQTLDYERVTKDERDKSKKLFPNIYITKPIKKRKSRPSSKSKVGLKKKSIKKESGIRKEDKINKKDNMKIDIDAVIENEKQINNKKTITKKKVIIEDKKEINNIIIENKQENIKIFIKEKKESIKKPITRRSKKKDDNMDVDLNEEEELQPNVRMLRSRK